jgi:hypothetical protein
MVPMMDEEDSQVPIWSYRVNLDKRVRDDHPLRRIRAALDLSFVRKEVAHTYGRRGNKSVPPEVIVRMSVARSVPTSVIQAIGPAPKAGRPRWIMPPAPRGTPSHYQAFTSEIVDPLSGFSQRVGHFFGREGTSFSKFQLFASEHSPSKHELFSLIH